MKRSISINLILFLLVLLISACGKKESRPKEEAAVPVTEQQESTESSEPEKPAEENNTGETDEQPEEITEEQAEKALKEISDKLSGYMWVAMMTEASGDITRAGKDYDIELTDAEKIRAAALSSETDGLIDTYFREDEGGLIRDENAQTGIDYGVFHGESISKKQLEENALDCFGLLADLDDLQEKPQCDMFDAVKYTDQNGTCPMVVDAELETETSIENHECRISKEGNNFIGEVDMFWGYWGQLEMNPGLSNYTVTYTLTPDFRSKYGLIVSGINVKMKDDSELIEEDQISGQEGLHEAFYGIWCMASDDKSKADKAAEKLISQGFEAEVFFTDDWEGLGAKGMYVVTAGIYPSRSDAEAALSDVRNTGYKDAYIKYSGDYTGKGESGNNGSSLSDEDAAEIAGKLGGKVCALEVYDYDGDGTKEAFTVIGEDDGEAADCLPEAVWFIAGDGSTTKMRTDFHGLVMYKNNEGYCLCYEEEHKGFFTAECGAYGSGWLSFIFSVKDGEPYELDLSMETEGFYQGKPGSFYTLTDNFDDGHKYMITELEYDRKTGQFIKGRVTDRELE